MRGRHWDFRADVPRRKTRPAHGCGRATEKAVADAIAAVGRPDISRARLPRNSERAPLSVIVDCYRTCCSATSRAGRRRGRGGMLRDLVLKFVIGALIRSALSAVERPEIGDNRHSVVGRLNMLRELTT